MNESNANEVYGMIENLDKEELRHLIVCLSGWYSSDGDFVKALEASIRISKQSASIVKSVKGGK